MLSLCTLSSGSYPRYTLANSATLPPTFGHAGKSKRLPNCQRAFAVRCRRREHTIASYVPKLKNSRIFVSRCHVSTYGIPPFVKF